MAYRDVTDEERKRLNDVRRRVIELVRENGGPRGWLGDVFRAEFEKFLALFARFRTKDAANTEWRLSHARRLLDRGLLVEPDIERDAYGEAHEGAYLTVIRWQLDEDDAARFDALVASGVHPTMPDAMTLRPPDGWEEAANPNIVSIEHVRDRFDESERRTIGFYWMGRLADSGAVERLVPEPVDTGDHTQDLIAHWVWSKLHDPEDAHNVFTLPPEVAERLLWDVVEPWIEAETVRRKANGLNDAASAASDDAKTKRLNATGNANDANETLPPPLTKPQQLVLRTMNMFDPTRLLSATMIVEEIDSHERLSDETVRKCVRKLIESGLAERPEGDRSGARLTLDGRRLAVKIAD